MPAPSAPSGIEVLEFFVSIVAPEVSAAINILTSLEEHRREFVVNMKYPAPKTLPGFPDATRAKPKTPIVKGAGLLRSRWKNPAGEIFEWDYRHGRVEKYTPKGRHVGEFDPQYW
jgi:hypothetical protein